MAFPQFPNEAFINALGDADLTHIGRRGAKPIEGILSIENVIEADGEYGLYVESITLDILEKDAALLEKGEVIKQGENEFIITAIPPADMGMIEVVLERKAK